MRIAFALAAALTPVAASAVTLTVNNRSDEVRIGINQCKSLQLIARWDLQTTPTGSDRIRLIGARNGSGACSSTSATTSPDRTFLDATPTSQTASATLSASDMVLSTSDAGVQPCDDPDVTSRSSANPLTNTLCVQYSLSSVFGGSSVSTASVNVKYALAPPFPPINIGVAPGDGHLKLNWSKGDDAEIIVQYDVHVEPEIGGTDGGVAATVTSTNADVKTTDDGQPLQNDAGYFITIVATDSYGNVSQPSVEVVGIPVATADFYNHYRDQGGSARGCASGGASVWIAGIAIALSLLLRRRSKARNGASLVALLALLGPAARADESERHPRFLIGFKLDRYDPKVDSEPGLTGTPYHDVFGTRRPLRYQLEFDWEVAHPFGALLIGATAGFWQNYGKAILRSSPPGSPQPSQDTTVLNVFPFGLIATYRFDWLANRWSRFPFIPYAQVGLMRALWMSYNGKGDVSSDPTNGGNGKGWTNGYTAALGIALSLNVIDVELAREAYIDTGIQRTSLFAEYGWTYLDNFGKSGALILTDRSWRFGVSVEF
ncbi:MAG TPA: MXAN_2562 family outer membrane beta-barrel protein [Myxococcales bacterium]|nr:MXAN_2562 family outer membrane beta-barrel protein [Myxococcales bacterium]